MKIVRDYWPLILFWSFLGFGTYEVSAHNARMVRAALQSFDATQDKSVFEMTDGYFLAGAWGQPVHLVHEPVAKQDARLGDRLEFTIKINLKKGVENPCSDRDDEPCKAELGLTNSTDGGCPQCVEHEFRIGEDRSGNFGFGGPISRKQPRGENHFLFRIKKDGKVLFSYEIPVEVQ